MPLLNNYINSRADFWAMKHRILRGKPYRFNGIELVKQRPFLQGMLADDARYKAYQKSRQAGVSENSVSESLFMCNKYDYRKFMYIFPTFGQMKDFVQTRIEPAIESSTYISSLVSRTKNSIRLKHIGNCDILFRSGSKASAGEGVDLDGVFFDERDRMHTSILDAFKEGLSSSDLGFIRDISTPSLPGTGVNISFEKSDKKFWFVRCLKCGKAQNLSYPDSFVKVKAENRYTYKCKHCGGYDCIDRSQGEWVPMITDVQTEVSGYQLSQLDCPWIAAGGIIKKREDMLPQFFFNYVLGRPYVGNNLLILQQSINNCIESGLSSIHRTGKIIAGVDWGDSSWIVIGMIMGKKVLILYYEKISFTDPEKHIQRVAELLRQYRVDLAVCDAGYGKDKNAALFKEFPNKVYACYYVDTRNSRIIDPVWGKNKPAVTVNRTVSLKVMARAWQKQEFILPKALVVSNSLTIDYFSHLKSLAIKLEEVEEGVIFERVGHTGPDHLAHATNYMFVGIYRALGRSYLGFLDDTNQTNPLSSISGSKGIHVTKESNTLTEGGLSENE